MTQTPGSGSIFGQPQPAAKPSGRDGGGKPPTNPALAALLAMDHVILGASPAALATVPALEAAIARADAIEQLRSALTDDVLRRFLPLMNTSLGFRCDRPNRKNPAPYSIDEVRTCMVEALLLGLRLTDNEWNIISGRCYVTREGLTRLIRDYGGLTDLRISAGVPAGDRTKGVTIPYACSWRLNGVEQTLEATIPVRGDEYATLDQLLGKGDRKIKARVWAKITGSEVSADGEVEIEIGHEAPAATQAKGSARAAIDELKQMGAKPTGEETQATPSNTAAPRAAEATSAPLGVEGTNAGSESATAAGNVAKSPAPTSSPTSSPTPAPIARPKYGTGDARAEPTDEDLARSRKPWDING